jgi:hypothetical protein
VKERECVKERKKNKTQIDNVKIDGVKGRERKIERVKGRKRKIER